MQGMGLYVTALTKEWVFASFRNNNIAYEFEKGRIQAHDKSLPNFGRLEQKYGKMVNKEDFKQDVEMIESQIQMSEQRKKKNGHGLSKDNGQGESKKKVLNILIEEQVPKRHLEQPNQSYCSIF